MKKVVTHLDDNLHDSFIRALGDVPVAKALRRFVKDFVEQKERESEAKR